MANRPKSVYQRELPEALVALSSVAGKGRLQSAMQNGHAETFLPLISQLQTQANPASCGTATLCTVLNAMRVDPKRVWRSPWRWFDEPMLDCCLRFDAVTKTGMSMDQVACTAYCEGVDVTVWRGSSVDAIRNLVTRVVAGREKEAVEFLAASYHRGVLGQTGHGHFSPISAYHEDTDSVLVLDVARFKYEPHWVPLELFVEATRPIDPVTGTPRGFILFRKTAGAPDISETPTFVNCCTGKQSSSSLPDGQRVGAV